MKKIKGTTHTEAAWWSQIVIKYGNLLPWQPGKDGVRAAIVPSPPLLPRGGDVQAAALLVARGYYAACVGYYGECRALLEPTMEAVKASGHYLVFARAVEKMRAYKLAPAAWSAFSIYVWQEFVVSGRGGQKWDSLPSARRRGPSRSSQPKPGWVFSEKRLEERTQWFGWVESRFRGGNVIFTPSLRELSRREQALRYHLLVAREGLTPDSVKRIVDSVLSPTRYMKLVEKANDEAEEHMENMKRKMKRGEWIWR